MKRAMCLVIVAMVAVSLVGCGGANVPSFLGSDNLTRIEVINNQTGQKGLASRRPTISTISSICSTWAT